jgi:hypothetical protein
MFLNPDAEVRDIRPRMTWQRVWHMPGIFATYYRALRDLGAPVLVAFRVAWHLAYISLKYEVCVIEVQVIK